MTERVWDRFLSDRDKARNAIQPAGRKGGGKRPALLMVDVYRWAFGDERQPLLEGIRDWPGMCGEAGWDALPHMQRVLAKARELGIPVLHISGMGDVTGWRDQRRVGTDAAGEKLARRYDLMPEVGPIEGEIVLRKVSPSAFHGTAAIDLLMGLGVDTVVVCGESTSGCVRATVVDAKSHRLKVLIPEPCVFDRDEASHAINLYDMDQKYADVMPVDEVLAYMESVAGAPVGAAR
jgi:nicotinamidase-related amidase